MEFVDKEIIWHNGFRMFDVPITASKRKVNRKFNRIEGMMNLGNISNRESLDVENNLAFPITPKPNFLNYQSANNRLSQPRSRFIDELFWFWPENLEDKNDETLTALKNPDANGALSIWKSSNASNASHNIAVYNQILAIDNEMANNTSGSQSYWKESLNYWHDTLSSNGFKNLALQRIQQIDDPTIKEDYVEEIFEKLPVEILSLNAKFAMDYYNNNEKSKFEMHLNLIKNSKFDQKTKDEALEDIFRLIYNSLSKKYEEFDKEEYDTPEDISKIDSFLDSIKEEFDVLKTHFSNRSDFKMLGDAIALSVKGSYVGVVNKAMKAEDLDKVLSIDYNSMSDRFDQLEEMAYTEQTKSNIKENHDTVKEIAETVKGVKPGSGVKPSMSASSDKENDAINKIGKFATNMDNMSISEAKRYAEDVESDLAELSGNHDNVSNLFAMSLNAFFNSKARGALEGSVDEFVSGLNGLMELLRIAEAYATESDTIKDIRENIDFAKELGARDPGKHTKPGKRTSSSGSSRTKTSSTPSRTKTTTTTSSGSGSGGGSNSTLIIGCVFWIVIAILALYFLGILRF